MEKKILDELQELIDALGEAINGCDAEPTKKIELSIELAKLQLEVLDRR